MQLIVLFGPKHSGKTTVGMELASLLSCRFIDLDEFIAKRSGKSPRTLYLEGPEVFRKAESRALAALFAKHQISDAQEVPSTIIIATGGGIVDNPNALAILKKHMDTISVFLDVSAQTAWERISRRGYLPPFLETENPQETHRLLHERRAIAYRQFASLVVEADGKSPGAIAREILKQIQGMC